MDSNQYIFFGNIRTNPSEDITKAMDLLSLVSSEEPSSSQIAACSIVRCTAYLAKMLHDQISYLAELEAHDKKIDPEVTVYGRLSNESLNNRLKEFPFVYSNKRFFIEPTNEFLHRLRTMVRQRNNLVHIPHGTVVMRLDPRKIEMRNGVPFASVKLPVPPDPWDQTSVEEASGMINAALIYVKEVFESGEDMKAGKILKESKKD